MLAFVVLALVGCGTEGSGTPASGGADGVAAGGRGPTMGSAGSAAFSLKLHALTPDGLGVDVDAMHLKPSAMADIVAHADPAAAHSVRFALLGTPLDAVLSLTETTTDATTGDAHVRLIAPSTPTTFQVQASAAGALPVTPLDLAVPKTGMAVLGVNASYAGERPNVNGWVASAWQDMTCAQLQGSPPDDGPIVASNTGFPVPLPVPTDTKLAVTLRAARFAWGCTTVNAATEGMQNDVEVVITNVPIQLDKSLVDFKLTLGTVDEFDLALAAPQQAALAAVVGASTDDSEALLDAMESEATDSGFGAARMNFDWDARVRDELGATDPLRAPLARWIEAGVASKDVAEGLLGSIQGKPGGAPSVALSSVFGVSPSLAGFTPTGTTTWTASADDRVVIGMGMSVSPAKFLLGAARAPALAEVPEADSVSAALAAVVSCADVAALLVAHGASKGNSTKGCDAGCTEQLCENALDTLVQAAAASDAGPSTLDIALTGSGSVGDDAQLTGFGGALCTWLGHWSLPDGTTNLSGLASGAAPTTATP